MAASSSSGHFQIKAVQAPGAEVTVKQPHAQDWTFAHAKDQSLVADQLQHAHITPPRVMQSAFLNTANKPVDPAARPPPVPSKVRFPCPGAAGPCMIEPCGPGRCGSITLQLTTVMCRLQLLHHLHVLRSHRSAPGLPTAPPRCQPGVAGSHRGRMASSCCWRRARPWTSTPGWRGTTLPGRVPSCLWSSSRLQPWAVAGLAAPAKCISRTAPCMSTSWAGLRQLTGHDLYRRSKDRSWCASRPPPPKPSCSSGRLSSRRHRSRRRA